VEETFAGNNGRGNGEQAAAKPTVCLYLHVHQPIRLTKFSLFRDVPRTEEEVFERYFDRGVNREYFERAAMKSYLPTNALLLNLINENEGRFKLSLSITGTFVEQCNADKGGVGGKVLESFRALAATGCVDILDETYYHSLASLFEDKQEFKEQVAMHRRMVEQEFGIRPAVFRNTEALYSNDVARQVEDMGYEGIVAEGWHSILGWRSPNYLYTPKGCSGMKTLLRNYKLSDDVGYRFSARWWNEWPLTADKYAAWLAACDGNTVNIFMDYETFGEHHWRDSGILEFLRHLPGEACKWGLRFLTARETIERYPAVGEVDCPWPLSWADMERDASAWLGNRIQNSSFKEVQSMKDLVLSAHNPRLERIWRLLTTSDHFYYMCTKSWADGDVHKHFSPHKDLGPYDNYVNYAMILRDFRERLEERSKAPPAPAGPSGEGELKKSLEVTTEVSKVC
jgi:alpha-amylase